MLTLLLRFIIPGICFVDDRIDGHGSTRQPKLHGPVRDVTSDRYCLGDSRLLPRSHASPSTQSWPQAARPGRQPRRHVQGIRTAETSRGVIKVFCCPEIRTGYCDPSFPVVVFLKMS